MSQVRVLVVDDSATMRSMIAAALGSDPAITVVGEAANPLEARDAIKALNPDVITLDVEMPKMDGIAFLEKIMRLRPMPVIMVSTLTSRGADATIKALEIGALDCVAKPSPENRHTFADLPAKVRMAAATRPRGTRRVIAGVRVRLLVARALVGRRRTRLRALRGGDQVDGAALVVLAPPAPVGQLGHPAVNQHLVISRPLLLGVGGRGDGETREDREDPLHGAADHRMTRPSRTAVSPART